MRRIQEGETDLLNEVVSKLREWLGGDLVAAVLFGSHVLGGRARAVTGTFWPLPAVCQEESWSALSSSSRCSLDYGGEVSLLAKTAEEFAAGLSSLYLDIAVDGVMFYDAGEYMARRLRPLRELIRRKGLRREKVGRNLICAGSNRPLRAGC